MTTLPLLFPLLRACASARIEYNQPMKDHPDITGDSNIMTGISSIRGSDTLNRLCAGLSVRELRVFGSAITGRFDPSRSDVDVLVDFFDPESPGIADRFMSLALGLESIFQRPVDLITKQAMKNPIFKDTVEKTSRSLYAA